MEDSEFAHIYFEEIEYICLEHSRKSCSRVADVISLDEAT